MSPYYQDDAVTIYHGDNRVVEVEEPWDRLALVSDPPYGMSRSNNYTIGPNGNKSGTRSRWDGLQIVGDDEPFDPTPWLGFYEVILWGANHFGWALPRGTTLVWIKRYDAAFGTYLSDAEVAWMKGSGHGVYCFRNAGYKTTEKRHHPTMKPLDLMRWCIGKTISPTILDPFAGSGTTLIAAKEAGRKAIGIEIEERYCEIAAKRCAQEVLAL